MSASAAIPIRSREAKILVARPQTEFHRKALRDNAALFRRSWSRPRRATRWRRRPSSLDAAQREKLLIEHLPQVRYIARRIHDRLPPQILLEDLVHAGILGLMDAVRKYDPKKNVQLRYYAEFRIRGAILDSLRQVDWSPRVLAAPGSPPGAGHSGLQGAAGARSGRTGNCRGAEHQSRKAAAASRRLARSGYRKPAVRLADSNSEESIQIPTGAEMDPYHQALRSERTALLGEGHRRICPSASGRFWRCITSRN